MSSKNLPPSRPVSYELKARQAGTTLNDSKALPKGIFEREGRGIRHCCARKLRDGVSERSTSEKSCKVWERKSRTTSKLKYHLAARYI